MPSGLALQHDEGPSGFDFRVGEGTLGAAEKVEVPSGVGSQSEEVVSPTLDLEERPPSVGGQLEEMPSGLAVVKEVASSGVDFREGERTLGAAAEQKEAPSGFVESEEIVSDIVAEQEQTASGIVEQENVTSDVVERERDTGDEQVDAWEGRTFSRKFEGHSELLGPSLEY